MDNIKIDPVEAGLKFVNLLMCFRIVASSCEHDNLKKLVFHARRRILRVPERPLADKKFFGPWELVIISGLIMPLHTSGSVVL
jgi:hypothetical protein